MIPKKIHFIYGLAPDFGGKPFSFCHYIAIASALKHNPDYEIKFWCEFVPESYYFDALRDRISVNMIKAPKEIFGNEIHHVAHAADVIRLEKLIEEGGFYLDIDSLTRKSFNNLLDNEFVIARETIYEKPVGLCNAIMASEVDSKFAKIWYSNYKSFRSKGYDDYWSEHSVQLPSKLSQINPELLTILPSEAFLKPDWTLSGMEDLFIKDLPFNDAYCHHLWESVSWRVLKFIDERNIMDLSFTYANIVKNDLSDDLNKIRCNEKSINNFNINVVNESIDQLINHLKTKNYNF